MPERLAASGWAGLRRAGYAAGLGLALAAAVDPPARGTAPAIEYLAVFDLTLSMAAEDQATDGLPRSRLDAARDVFRRAIPDLPATARLSVGGFAGGTVQVFLLSHPVTEREGIEAALSVLEWDNVWDVGSRVDRGLRDIAAQAQRSPLFSAAGRRRVLPESLNIVFFTDGGGEDAKPTVPGDATAWLARRARVTLVGVGGTRPAAVPEPSRGGARDCLRDERGGCYTSRLNDETLRSLAEWVEGRYERLSDAGALVRLLLDEPLTRGEADVERGTGWAFGLASVAAFLLWTLV